VKEPYRHVFFWALFAMSILGGAIICRGTEPIPILERRVSQLEELWTTGSRGTYYKELRSLTTGILAESKKRDVNNVATELFESILSNDFEINHLAADELSEIGMADLYAMQNLASYLLSHGDVSAAERQMNARLLCRYLGKIRRDLVPNYERKPVFTNVDPPEDVPGIKISGMNPEAIKDPVARAKYQAAIRKNQENNLANMRQSFLHDRQITTTKPILAYLMKTLRAEEISPDFVDECIKSAELTDKEKREVLKGRWQEDR
jgi:hypothetical protein